MSSSALTVVKSTQSFTLEFIGSTADPCLTKGYIESSPQVQLVGNSFFFNYSQSKNVNDFKFLKLFFDKLSVGSTFSFSSGKYSNITTGSVLSWDGQFTLQGKTGAYNQYLYFSGLTGTSGISAGIYNRNLFTTPIQFTAVTGGTAALLVNKSPDLDPLNFTYLGIYGSDYSFEEYLQVNNSTLNQKRILIKNVLKLNDGTEVIYVDPTVSITNENLYFQQSMVDIYMRGILTPDDINYDQTLNGILRISNTYPGVYTQLLENQNKQQFLLRQLLNPVYPVNYYWYPNTKLINFTSSEVAAYTNASYIFAKIYQLVYDTITIPLFSTSAILDVPTLIGEETYNVILINNNDVGYINFNASNTATTKNFKIDLSDARNTDLTISAYSDFACSVPLPKNFAINGTPGKEGAAFIYFADRPDTLQSVYLKLERETTMILSIQIS
jgi:hypothetical protein